MIQPACLHCTNCPASWHACWIRRITWTIENVVAGIKLMHVVGLAEEEYLPLTNLLLQWKTSLKSIGRMTDLFR
jgi:hypothetical protein